MGAIAVGVGIDPLLVIPAITVTVSCAFMLPAATPYNVGAFTTSERSIRRMIRAGIWLDLIDLVLIGVALHTLVPQVFNIHL